MNTTADKSSFSSLGFFIWFLAALFFMYEFFLRTFLGSVAHQVIPDLSLNAETFALIGSAYYLTYGIMQVPVGVCVDRFGVKLVLTLACVVCALATFLFAHASGFYTALLSRLLMGFGSSFAFVCLLVVAVTWFPKKYFGFFAGASQFIGTLGPILAGGPLITFMVKTHETWREVIEKISIAGLILAVVIFIFVKSKKRDEKQKLVILEREEPLLQGLKKLFRNKQAWGVALYSASVYVSISLLGVLWGTEFLQVHGFSQKVAADIVSLAWLGYAIACPFVGGLSDYLKRRKPTLVICACLGLIATSFITYYPFAQASYFYGVLFFMLGIAAAGQSLGFATISEHVDASVRATGLGLNNMAIILFGAIIPPIASYFIYQSGGKNIAHFTAHTFTTAFTVMPILYLVSTILALFVVGETFARSQKEVVFLEK